MQDGLSYNGPPGQGAAAITLDSLTGDEFVFVDNFGAMLCQATVRTIASGGLGIFNIKQFGAKGDGVTNDAPAIQAAIHEASAVGGTVYSPPGRYLMMSGATITADGVRFIGSGLSSVLVAGFASGDLLHSTTTSSVEIADLKFDASVTRTSGAYVRSTNSHNPYIHDLVIDHGYDGIVVEGGAQQFICNIERIEASRCSDAALLLQDYPQDVFIRQITGGSNGEGLKIRSASNVHADMVDFILSAGPGVHFNADQTLPIQNMFFTRVQADTGSAEGFLFSGTQPIDTVYLTDCWGASSTADAGFRIFNPASTNIELKGCNASSNYKSGFSLEGGSKITLIGCQGLNNSAAGANAFSGLYIGSGVTQVVANGNHFGDGNVPAVTNNQQYGVLAASGAGPHIALVGNDVFGNMTAGMSLDVGITNLNVTSNLGHRTATSNFVDIVVGNSFVDVPLGIDAPDPNIVVVLSCHGDPNASGVTRVWYTGPISGTMRVHADATVSGSNLSIAWQAVAYGD